MMSYPQIFIVVWWTIWASSYMLLSFENEDHKHLLISGKSHSVLRWPFARFHINEILGSLCVQKSQTPQRQRWTSLHLILIVDGETLRLLTTYACQIFGVHMVHQRSDISLQGCVKDICNLEPAASHIVLPLWVSITAKVAGINVGEHNDWAQNNQSWNASVEII